LVLAPLGWIAFAYLACPILGAEGLGIIIWVPGAIYCLLPVVVLGSDGFARESLFPCDSVAFAKIVVCYSVVALLLGVLVAILRADKGDKSNRAKIKCM
jgi:hypothetical protein